MRAVVMLCDHAEVADGKLFINGGGWEMISGETGSPTGLAVLIYVPWDQTNQKRKLHVSLVDQDGRPAMQHIGNAQGPIQVDIEFEVGRPPGLKPGSEVRIPFALNFPPMKLQPNSAYTWVLETDGEEVGRASFGTRAK